MKIKDYLYATIQLPIVYILNKRTYGKRVEHRKLYKGDFVQDRPGRSAIPPPVSTMWV